MSLLNQLLYSPDGGQFREYIGINTFIEPADHDLYRKLLPQPFDVPLQPVVAVFAADYLKMAPWPLSRYQEWAVLLKCTWKGDEGWHCITMPVTKWVPMVGGRQLGFPKYIADSISLDKHGQSWIAKSIFKRDEQLQLQFQPGLTRSLTDWENELISDETFFKKGDAFLLFPPSKGPRIKRIHLDNVVPAHWSPEPGMVQIRVNQAEPWAGLVQDSDAHPGSFNHFVGGVNLVEV